MADEIPRAIAKRVTIKQIGGDDGYQWNVLIDGRSIANGMTKREATHEQNQQRLRLYRQSKQR
jgi:hypothetical protein